MPDARAKAWGFDEVWVDWDNRWWQRFDGDWYTVIGDYGWVTMDEYQRFWNRG